MNGPTATPDNTCENCLAILDGTALDVLEIDAASNRGIDEIRALRDAVKFAPSAMRKKVYIIDEAHMLTKEGANAFLKTLEEPPEHAVFILATTAPESLPPTILSRCQRYAFRRIAIPMMIARMREIAAAEGIAIDDAALGAIAYRADGGLRDALTMLEQVAAFASGPVDASTVDAAFGQTGRAFARALRDAALDGDAAAALRTIDEARDAGADMTGLIRSTIAEFRHLLVARVNPELLARDLAEDDAATRARTRRARRRRRGWCARCACSPTRSRRRATPATRGSSSRARCCASFCRPKTRRSTRSPRASPRSKAAHRCAAARRPQPAAAASPSRRRRARRARPEAAAGAAAAGRTGRCRRSRAAGRADGPLAAEAALAVAEHSQPGREREALAARRLSRATVEALDGDVLTLRVPDPIGGRGLKRDVATVKKAIADVIGRASTCASRSAPAPSRGGDRRRRPTAAKTPDDLMRYALEKLS